MDPKIRLAQLAQTFLGVTETTPNHGPEVDLFNSALGQKPIGQSYCCNFLQYLCKLVDKEFQAAFPSWQPYRLFHSESAVKVFNSSPLMCRLNKPGVGLCVFWQHYFYLNNQWQPSWQGHCGVVIKINDDGTMMVCEGNTSPNAGDQIIRDGGGVWLKQRHIVANTGSMRLLGFLTPWPD